MTSLTRPLGILIKGTHFLRGNPKGTHTERKGNAATGIILTLNDYYYRSVLLEYSSNEQRSSSHRKFQAYTSLGFLGTDYLKNGSTALKSFRGFRGVPDPKCHHEFDIAWICKSLVRLPVTFMH